MFDLAWLRAARDEIAAEVKLPWKHNPWWMLCRTGLLRELVHTGVLQGCLHNPQMTAGELQSCPAARELQSWDSSPAWAQDSTDPNPSEQGPLANFHHTQQLISNSWDFVGMQEVSLLWKTESLYNRSSKNFWIARDSKWSSYSLVLYFNLLNL